MTIIKKTIFAALAAAVMSTAGVSLTATSSQAGHYYGHGYYQPKVHCGWKRVKHWNGYQWIWYRKWICG